MVKIDDKTRIVYSLRILCNAKNKQHLLVFYVNIEVIVCLSPFTYL